MYDNYADIVLDNLQAVGYNDITYDEVLQCIALILIDLIELKIPQSINLVTVLTEQELYGTYRAKNYLEQRGINIYD